MQYRKQKGHDITIKSRFVNDLLLNLSMGKKFNADLDIGFGLCLGDITNHLTPYHNPTHFSGVYLQYQADGSILFKAMKAKAEGNDKVLSKTFSIKKYGIQKAFQEAVRIRAGYCSYNGNLPLENLTPPTAAAILEHAIHQKGEDWVKQHNTQSLLEQISGVSP